MTYLHLFPRLSHLTGSVAWSFMDKLNEKHQTAKHTKFKVVNHVTLSIKWITLTSKLDSNQYWVKQTVRHFLWKIYVRSFAGFIALNFKRKYFERLNVFIWPTFFFEIEIMKRENDMQWFLLMTPRELSIQFFVVCLFVCWGQGGCLH